MDVAEASQGFEPTIETRVAGQPLDHSDEYSKYNIDVYNKAPVGFEPTIEGFAGPAIRPLWHSAIN